MNDTIKGIGLFVVGAGVLLLGVRGCNVALNNRTIVKSAFYTESRATGIYGHVEYTRYSDGSQDIKIYSSLSHRFFGSELHQDFNGDGLVDRIRRDGPEWKMHRLNDILERKIDYESNKDRFDKADAQLKELMIKYPARK